MSVITIGFVVKKSSNKEDFNQEGFTVQFYQTFTEEIIPILHNLPTIETLKTSQLILWGQHYPENKIKDKKTILVNIPHEYRHKNFQQKY